MFRLILVTIIATMLSEGSAVACDCVRLIPGSPRFESDLDRIAGFYPVAAEGVIEREGPYHWRFTPTREFRGPGQASYLVALISDCSLAPNEMDALIGKPVFVLLVEGPGDHRGKYELSRCVNLLGEEVETAIKARLRRRCKTY